MPQKYTRDIRDQAYKLWADGYTPEEIVRVIKDRGCPKFSVRTLQRWAKDYHWGNWRDYRRQQIAQTDAITSFGVSRIVDPITHLCTVYAKRQVKEHPLTRSIPRRENGTVDIAQDIKNKTKITNEVIKAVEWMYEPTPWALAYLKPVIKDYIVAVRAE